MARIRENKSNPTPNNMFEFETQEDGVKIAINAKRFDATNANQFKEEMGSKFNPRPKHVEVDLSQIDFIDSSGIGALLSIQKQLDQSSDPIVLINPKPAVLSIIELLRLHRVFKLQSN